MRAGRTLAGDRFYSRIFALVTTALLAAALYAIVAPFLKPLMWALFIAFLLHPVHLRTQRRWARPNLSALTLTLATCFLLVGPITAMSAAFVAQASELAQWIQQTLSQRTDAPYGAVTDLPLIGSALQWLNQTFNLRIELLNDWLAQLAKSLPQHLAAWGGQLFLGALNTAAQFAIMLFTLFFFLRDGASYIAALRDLVPMPGERRDQLLEHVAGVTRAVVFGVGVTALVQGAIVGVAFAIASLSSPLVFGVIAALLALLPVGGAALVWIPAVGVLLAHQRWGMAIAMLAIGVFCSTIDNVLRPLLISGRAQVGTLTIFIGVLGGMSAFGSIGLFIGPVMLAFIIALVQFALELRRAAPPTPQP